MPRGKLENKGKNCIELKIISAGCENRLATRLEYAVQLALINQAGQMMIATDSMGDVTGSRRAGELRRETSKG
jgi:hypothetical protein